MVSPGFWNKAVFWQTVLNTDQDSGGPWRRTSPPNHLKAQKGPSRCLPWAAIAAVGALGGLPRLKWEWKWERAVKWTQASGHQNFQLSENFALILALNKVNLSWQLLATCLVTWPFENLEGLVTWSSLLQWPGGSGGSFTPSCVQAVSETASIEELGESPMMINILPAKVPPWCESSQPQPLF